jgi:hypothetical protein
MKCRPSRYLSSEQAHLPCPCPNLQSRYLSLAQGTQPCPRPVSAQSLTKRRSVRPGFGRINEFARLTIWNGLWYTRCPLLMPFTNQIQRDLHFLKHGHKFGAANADEYEKMAEDFMYGPMKISMRECTRPNKAHRLRYNDLNRHFGAACVAPAVLMTFYPVPSRTIHHHGGNAAYFAHECGRTDL